MSNELKYNKWVKYPNGVIYPSDSITVQDNLTPGIYKIGYHPQKSEFFLEPNNFVHDDLIFHESAEYIAIMEEIKSFWNLRNVYEQNSYVHKRGLLLAGAPGTGKTSLINLCLDWFFNEVKGIVVSISSMNQLLTYCNMHKTRIREIEPTTPMICIIEDIDGYVYGGNEAETELLNILDGNNQINNVLYIATTNYPEKLSSRLSRPGRFDVKIEIKFPTKSERELYLRSKLGDISNMSEWLDKTEDMTLATISEIVKQYKIYNKSLDNILETLEGYSKIKSSHQFNKKSSDSIGFNRH